MKKHFPILILALAASIGTVNAQESMYSPQTYRALIADQKAMKVGDAVTILVQEAASASSTVDARANRSQDIGLRGQTTGQDARGISGGTSSSSDSGGQVVRSGRVTAQISATVTAIQPNGEMLIEGKQTVEVNGESQIITVSGRVRAKDISDNNAVLSSRLADARISYSGEGYLANKSQPSIWSRLVTWIGL